MQTVIADAARTIVPSSGDRHGPLPPMLLVLTIVTGVVDAVSYLRLGHVFVANMTGNVVFLGFALAGASGLSAVASIVALAAFLLGALAGGHLGTRLGQNRGRLLAAATAVKTVLVAVALIVAALAGESLTEAARYALIVLLALAMGLQNATARKLAVPDLTTTVLTLTLTGLAADSEWAGGNAPRPGRRLVSVASMLIGAVMGGLLVLRVSIAATLGLATGLLLLTGLAVHRLSFSSPSWVAPA
ncbi:MAG: DUF1275 domain-containing protein [Planctomycetaceae bacterium]|nr:DUF1275 domain-containing protein [Planctomycetaceae bacterium]